MKLLGSGKTRKEKITEKKRERKEKKEQKRKNIKGSLRYCAMRWSSCQSFALVSA